MVVKKQLLRPRFSLRCFYNIRTICSYRRVLRHLHENVLTAADLSRIQNALTFLSPLCRDTREAHEDMMGVPLKTDALLRAGR